jgi:hypothetical protein
VANNNDYTTAVRSSAVLLGLAGIIAVHVMDLPGKMSEVPYLGFLYVGIILTAGFLMYRVIKGPTSIDFLAIAALSIAVILGYVVNRTVGMPGAMDDIGNWFEPLGLLSLVIEAWLILISLSAFRAMSDRTSNISSNNSKESVSAT